MFSFDKYYIFLYGEKKKCWRADQKKIYDIKKNNDSRLGR